VREGYPTTTLSHLKGWWNTTEAIKREVYISVESIRESGVYSIGRNRPKEARDFMGRGATLKMEVPGLKVAGCRKWSRRIFFILSPLIICNLYK
jgi:hypothetical protein